MNVVEVNVLHTRADAIRRFFELPDGSELLMPDVEALEWSAAMAAHVRDFNLEWHIIPATSSLELGFYMDARKDAELFVVGPNRPGDFSYVDPIETHPDWSPFGFRLALVPDVTGEETFP
jgi:hypothetical protein